PLGCALMSTWFDELADFLRIPSISADPEHRQDVEAAGGWVKDFIRRAGGQAELIDWHGKPLVVGEISASAGAEAPTILCYGHFDVQPPDPLELWDSEPFELTERDGRLYARGIADDKGQVYTLLAAARDLAAAGELPVSVRFALDGEEETGGHSIVEYIAADKDRADAAIIFDSGMIGEDRPAFNVAMRGLVYFHLTLRTGESDLHSGIYGGAAMNAGAALIQTLEALLAKDGQLAEPLRAGVLAPTAEELAGWAQLPAGADELASQGATPADPKAAEDFYLRTFAQPTLEINGIHSGSPDLEKTVLPVEAVANVSLRLAPGQDPDRIAAAFEQLVHAAVPAGAGLKVERWSSAPAGIIPPDAKAIQLGLDAFEQAMGVRPALIRSGGSLPIVAALADRQIPTIISGFCLPDAQIHAPNENLRADYVDLGIKTAKALFRELAKL
ncbi:MAG: M20/M25/M40 family metallo-hydrolase, partial [Solirubrobacterales bacterium]|nr:M20/M25/M40 family metallo-hydrolase [Solirubrobacterales bacterium]